MAWINYTSGNISEFALVYPDAVVVVSENEVERRVLNFDDGTVHISVAAKDHQKVTEYRALTLETAEHLKAEVTTFDKKRLVLSYSDSTYGQHHANCPDIIGTERLGAITRANEANGYTLTVTESTTRWGYVDLTTGETVYDTVSGEYKGYGMTGSGSGVFGDVRISWGHSA